MEEVVCILDCGAQYAKVIDRRVRELNINTEILPIHTAATDLLRFNAIIISGGPESVYSNVIKYDSLLFGHEGNSKEAVIKVPILGICFGMQMMAFCSGGLVEKKLQREDGQFKIKVDNTSPLFDGLDEEQEVLLTHGDSVEKVGAGFKVIAKSGNLISAISNDERKQYGVQFHPEVDLTVNGIKIFENFLFKICGLRGKFTMEDRRVKAINFIKSKVGSKKVLVLASGGVDSTVCAALLNEAIGADKVIALHVNNGFMRKNESENVCKALGALGLSLINVDASEDFYNGRTQIPQKSAADGSSSLLETNVLKESINPEEKRKIIGDTFMRIAQSEILKLGLKAEDVFLAQGTLRPDIIESGSPTVSQTAHTIKTHHNDTNLVRELRNTGRVIEPLSDYHKDEVRRLGRALGLPDSIVMRHPFPGPGLAVRIICAPEQLTIDSGFDESIYFLSRLLQCPESITLDENKENVDHIESQIQSNLKDYERTVLDEIRKLKKIRATLLPIKTVGVQGDGRSYNFLCALSTISDTPDWNHLMTLAKFIPRLKHNINRVVYVFGSEPLPEINSKVAPLMVTPTTMQKNVIQLLQEADDIVTEVLLNSNTSSKVSQVPVILFPVNFGKPGAHSVAIRTMITNDFMTGRPAIPDKDIPSSVLHEIVSKIEVKLKDNIVRVVYDLTSKPPGTTEWE